MTPHIVDGAPDDDFGLGPAYRFSGGPLAGRVVRARRGASLCRSAAGMPLPAAEGDRAVHRINRGLEPKGVYLRQGSAYVWAPDWAARRRAEADELAGTGAGA